MYWLGGTSFYNSDWEWSDNSIIDFINWNKDQPNNYNGKFCALFVLIYNFFLDWL